MNATTFLLIVAMAAVTFATRISGILIGPKLPKTGRARQALDAVPIAVLAALITPQLTTGSAELAGGIVTIFLALRIPTIGAVIGGMGSVAVIRSMGGVERRTDRGFVRR